METAVPDIFNTCWDLDLSDCLEISEYVVTNALQNTSFLKFDTRQGRETEAPATDLSDAGWNFDLFEALAKAKYVVSDVPQATALHESD